jgi:hypothetical protein
VVNVQLNLGKTGNEALRDRHAGQSVNIPRCDLLRHARLWSGGGHLVSPVARRGETATERLGVPTGSLTGPFDSLRVHVRQAQGAEMVKRTQHAEII